MGCMNAEDKKRKNTNNYNNNYNSNNQNHNNNNNSNHLRNNNNNRNNFNRNIINNQENIINNNNNNDPNNITFSRLGIEPYLQSQHIADFNFPEVEQDLYVGHGLKKMKGYISNIPKSELQKRRKDFWETRIEGNQEIWAYLREICEMEDVEGGVDVEELLDMYNIRPYKNCINIVYDQMGNLYEIPNYCIHEPSKYDLPELKKEPPKNKKIINFIIRNGKNQIKVSYSNYCLVKEVKKFLGKKYGTNEKNVRLFYYGKEMQNEQQLWIYNTDNDSVVTMMITSG